jgi:hypothetical protein
MTKSPFDHTQDQELGEVLRAVLTGHDDEAFARRVMARVADMQEAVGFSTAWWEVLGSWARPGLVAAAIGLILSATILVTGLFGGPEPPVALGDPLQPVDQAGVLSALLSAGQPPDLNEVLALGLSQ